MKKNFTNKLRLVFLSLFVGVLPSLSAITGGDEDFEFSEDATHVPAMIKVDDGDVNTVISELEDLGVDVLYHRQDILLTFIPVEVLPQLYGGNESRRAKGIRSVQPGKPRYNRPTMDDARGFLGAGRISEGVNLPMAYDGKGVIVGICDIGMDTRHPNFLTSDGNECRIRKVVHYREEFGERTELVTPQSIYDWRTDNDDEYHATHVTGIAAGGYKSNGYHSLAPSADIVFTASQLSDVGLLAGVEDIIAYAKEKGRPVVINLSMGNVLGPRDGSSLFTQYLDLCAEDAIICISAGNDGSGDEPHGLRVDFTDSKKKIEVQTTDWAGLHNRGRVEVWSADATPFKFSLYLHNDKRRNDNIYAFDILDFTNPELTSWRVSADPDDPDHNETFAAHYFAGYISVTGGVSSLNGRYFVSMEMDCETEEISPGSSGPWALYWPGVMVEGEPGTHVDIHAGAGYCFLRQERTYEAPGPDYSISDLATGFKTISVGMTNNKDHETLINGTERDTGYPSEGVNRHSSYGTLLDGRILPMTCAPGSMVVSSMSGAFLEKYPENIPYMNAEVDYGGGKAYWMSEIGTSMATPYVAGAIATWLQAYPNLTSEEAIKYVMQTNRRPDVDEENPRNGMGWFDAYGGLVEILKATILNVEDEKLQNIAVSFNGRDLIVDNPTGSRVNLDVFSVSGMKVFNAGLNDGRSAVSLGNIDSGIYFLHLKTGNGMRKIEKIFVR